MVGITRSKVLFLNSAYACHTQPGPYFPSPLLQPQCTTFVCRSFCTSRRNHWTALPRHLLPSFVSCFFTVFFCRALACDVTPTLQTNSWPLAAALACNIAHGNQSCYLSNSDPYSHKLTQHGHPHPRPASPFERTYLHMPDGHDSTLSSMPLLQTTSMNPAKLPFPTPT